MLAQFIVTTTILDLCLEVEHQTGAWVEKRWWKKEGINIAVIWWEAVVGIPEEEEGQDENEMR